MLFEWVVVVARCQVVFVIMSKLTKPRAALVGKTDFGTSDILSYCMSMMMVTMMMTMKTELKTKHIVWRLPLT